MQCPNCRHLAQAKVAGEKRYAIHEGDVYGRYIFATCDGCSQPVLFDEEYDPHSEVSFRPRVIYPEAGRKFGGDIPTPARIAYEEAETCFDAGANTAAALMCRRCIEAIGHDKGAKGNSLLKKIEWLQNESVVPAEFVEWFDTLRQVGNQAAHDVTAPVSASDAKDTVEFTHALLEFIYSYRQKFDEFRSRRSAKNGDSS